MAVTEVGQILQDLSVIMIIAGGMAMLSWRFKQPLIVGYIGAGMIIGPHTPPFSLILNLDVLNLFAEIGIVLLLFVVGMEFPIEKLKKVGRKAFIIALAEALGTFSIGFIVGQYALSFPFYDSLFLALAVSVTSTVIVMRVLEELGMIKEESSVLILSVAIIEDIIVISMLAILQSTSSTGGLSFADIGISVGITLAFIVGVLVIGSKTVPRMVDYVSRTNQHDVLVVIFLAVASRFQGLSKLTSLRAGIGLSSSGGELALVVAKGGDDVGVTSSFLLPMVGAMTIITTFISPYVIKFGWRFAEAFVNKRKKV
jgi:CPA2 family monovalent cation:H+ antiporter-2